MATANLIVEIAALSERWCRKPHQLLTLHEAGIYRQAVVYWRSVHFEVRSYSCVTEHRSHRGTTTAQHSAQKVLRTAAGDHVWVLLST